MKKEKAKVDNNNIIEKEDRTNKTDEAVEQKMAKKKVPKQVSQEILKKIFKNLILAIIIMIYFISGNIVYTQLEWNQMEMITKAISGVFLLASIIILEFAYKRDSGTLTMTAIELLVLSIHALFIYHITTIYQFDFRTYLIISSYMFAIYYVLKSTVIYTRARIRYLKSLSDISEIVKDEPIIREAKKRKEEQVIDPKEEQVIDPKEEVKKEKEEKPKNSKTRKTTKTNKKKKQEKIKNEPKNEIQEQNEGNKEQIVKEVKKQPKPKSKRGRKKKEEVVKND